MSSSPVHRAGSDPPSSPSCSRRAPGRRARPLGRVRRGAHGRGRARCCAASLDDLDSLRAGAADTDGTVHLAYIHDFSQFEENAQHRPARDRGDGRGARGIRPAVRDRVRHARPRARAASAVETRPTGYGTPMRPRVAAEHRSRSPTAACAPPVVRSRRPCTARATTASWPPWSRIAREQGRVRLRRRRRASGGRRCTASTPPASSASRSSRRRRVPCCTRRRMRASPIRDIAEMIGAAPRGAGRVGRAAEDAMAHFGWLGRCWPSTHRRPAR